RAALVCAPGARLAANRPSPQPSPTAWERGHDRASGANGSPPPLAGEGEGEGGPLCHENQIERQPPLSGTIGTAVPALMAGARGVRTTRQSAFDRKDSMELSCLSNGVATRRPCASCESRARR